MEKKSVKNNAMTIGVVKVEYLFTSMGVNLAAPTQPVNRKKKTYVALATGCPACVVVCVSHSLAM